MDCTADSGSKAQVVLYFRPWRIFSIFHEIISCRSDIPKERPGKGQRYHERKSDAVSARVPPPTSCRKRSVRRLLICQRICRSNRLFFFFFWHSRQFLARYVEETYFLACEMRLDVTRSLHRPRQPREKKTRDSFHSHAYNVATALANRVKCIVIIQ